jgi:hypothetical protein
MQINISIFSNQNIDLKCKIYVRHKEKVAYVVLLLLLLLLIVIKFAQIFAPVLGHVLNIRLLQGKLSTLWKQAAFDPVFKNGKSALITN